MPFAGSIIPKGWALCNGALLSIQQNSALFSLLGTYYGGNGVTTFGLPNLMGRTILGADTQGSYVPGMISGTTAVSLSTATLPSHPHGIQAKTDQITGRSPSLPTNNIFATNTLPAGNPTKIFVAAGKNETQLALGTNVLNEGGGSPHNNMQPYLTISYLIALQGVFPSRD
jgi:microcystin-dependent protein